MSNLTPFDIETILMIQSILGIEPTIEEREKRFNIVVPFSNYDREIKEAVAGRFGERLLDTFVDRSQIYFIVRYDENAKNMPEEIRTEYTHPNVNVGNVFCRRLLEIRALKVERNNLEKLLEFTGGGTMTIPRTLGGIAKYSFANENGLILDVPENWYVAYNARYGFSIMNPDDFKRNFEPKDMPETTTKIYNTVQRFDMLFGRNLDLRLRKLTEEYNELISAAENYRKNGTLTDKDKENIVDELADVNAVIFHIASLFGLSQTELLAMAVDKIEGRLHNPDYNRKHPHTGDECCGNCKHFVNEEAGGDGYCYNQGRMRHCSCSGCEDWKNGVGQ